MHSSYVIICHHCVFHRYRVEQTPKNPDYLFSPSHNVIPPSENVIMCVKSAFFYLTIFQSCSYIMYAGMHSLVLCSCMFYFQLKHVLTFFIAVLILAIARHRRFTTETFEYVHTPVDVLTWSHKPLYTLNITQNQKIITNVGPEFLTLIFIFRTAAKEVYSRVSNCRFPLNLTQWAVSVVNLRCLAIAF